MQIDVYSDGSATTAEKPGGWAYVITVDGKKVAECAGHSPTATNNDMELEAAIQGLTALVKLRVLEPSYKEGKATLVSDSQLVLGWASGRYKFKQMEKIEKYNQLRKVVDHLKADTRWVRGHSGDEHNERCDKLANAARRGITDTQERAEKKAKGETLIGTKKTGTIAVWYKDVLKIVDLETNIIENYDREIHGSRGSIWSVNEEKNR